MEEAKLGQIQEDLTFLQGPVLPRFPELSTTPGCSHDGESPLSGTFPAPSLLLCWVPAWQGSLETSLYPPSTRCETQSFLWPLVLAGLSLLFGSHHRPPARSVQAWGTGTLRSCSTSLSPAPSLPPVLLQIWRPCADPLGQVCIPHHLSVCGGLCPGRQTPLGSHSASHTARHGCQHALTHEYPRARRRQAGGPRTRGPRPPPLSPTHTADREPGRPDVQRRVLSARRASSRGLVVGQITTPLSPPGHTHGAHAGTSTPLGGNLADRHRNTPTPRPPWGFTRVHIISFRCGGLELGTTPAGSVWPQPVFFPLFWVT